MGKCRCHIWFFPPLKVPFVRLPSPSWGCFILLFCPWNLPHRRSGLETWERLQHQLFSLSFSLWQLDKEKSEFTEFRNGPCYCEAVYSNFLFSFFPLFTKRTLCVCELDAVMSTFTGLRVSFTLRLQVVHLFNCLSIWSVSYFILRLLLLFLFGLLLLLLSVWT